MNKFRPSFNLFFSDDEPWEKELSSYNKMSKMTANLEPEKASVLNVLAYSKSLSVKNTKALGTMFLNLN